MGFSNDERPSQSEGQLAAEGRRVGSPTKRSALSFALRFAALPCNRAVTPIVGTGYETCARMGLDY